MSDIPIDTTAGEDTFTGAVKPPILPEDTVEQFSNDPLMNLLGPKAKKIQVDDNNPDEQIPEAVADFLVDNELDGAKFRCELSEMAEGEDPDRATGASYISGWSQSIPTQEWIAKNYGPGIYRLSFSWKGKTNVPGIKSQKRRSIVITISEKFRDIYEEFQEVKRQLRAAKAVAQIKKQKIAMASDPILNMDMPEFCRDGSKTRLDEKPVDSAKKYIAELMDTNRMLGINPGLNVPAVIPPQKGFDWEKVLPAALAALPALLTFMQNQQMAAQQNNNHMMMMMLKMSEESKNTTLEMVKTMSGNNRAADAVKEYKDMIMGAIDIKQAINGTVEEKETIADKIFRMIESIAPLVLTLATKTPAQRAADPMLTMAKPMIEGMPEYEAMKKDPELLAIEIRRLDDHFGWAQTDGILTVMGFERPPTCPRNPDEELPYDARPKNPVETGLRPVSTIVETQGA
jgi:hypothetical protein